MTREEAIKRLNWVREQIDEKPIHYTHQALDMAIKALSETHDKRIETHECDYISRQAAIDALGEEPEVRSDNDQYDQYDLGLNNQWWDDVNAIKALTPEQPEQQKGKWIDDTYCSICGWANEVESGFIGSVKGFNFCPNCGKGMQHD